MSYLPSLVSIFGNGGIKIFLKKDFNSLLTQLRSLWIVPPNGILLRKRRIQGPTRLLWL
ncbi:hypothetical protein RchiOBHm_Chr5g0048621 [Rosa chinensis]|uniref:Uncharacterized protein n=1 Tax=Rosa chinensis TaxID=74649 RepID=A0A2P6QEP1_ROSCH|nr:hypothetical protein RchiOBHm_Chr5g0048621 [Rosa chinensis]